MMDAITNDGMDVDVDMEHRQEHDQAEAGLQLQKSGDLTDIHTHNYNHKHKLNLTNLDPEIPDCIPGPNPELDFYSSSNAHLGRFPSRSSSISPQASVSVSNSALGLSLSSSPELQRPCPSPCHCHHRHHHRHSLRSDGSSSPVENENDHGYRYNYDYDDSDAVHKRGLDGGFKMNKGDDEEDEFAASGSARKRKARMVISDEEEERNNNGVTQKSLKLAHHRPQPGPSKKKKIDLSYFMPPQDLDSARADEKKKGLDYGSMQGAGPVQPFVLNVKMNRGFEGGYGYGREVGHDPDRAEDMEGSRVDCWNGQDMSDRVRQDHLGRGEGSGENKQPFDVHHHPFAPEFLKADKDRRGAGTGGNLVRHGRKDGGSGHDEQAAGIRTSKNQYGPERDQCGDFPPKIKLGKRAKRTAKLKAAEAQRVVEMDQERSGSQSMKRKDSMATTANAHGSASGSGRTSLREEDHDKSQNLDSQSSAKIHRWSKAGSDSEMMDAGSFIHQWDPDGLEEEVMNSQEAPAAPGLTLFSPDDFAEMIPAGQLSRAERRANLLIERLARKDKGKEFTQITKLESKPISHLAKFKVRQQNRGIFLDSLGLDTTSQLPQEVGDVNRLTRGALRPLMVHLSRNVVYTEKVDKAMRGWKREQLRASVELEEADEQKFQRTYDMLNRVPVDLAYIWVMFQHKGTAGPSEGEMAQEQQSVLHELMEALAAL